MPERHVTELPALIAEILSPSTADRDRNEKLSLYQDNGVNYYLIADPNDFKLEAFARNAQGIFQSLGPGTIYEFQLCDNCRIKFDSTLIV